MDATKTPEEELVRLLKFGTAKKIRDFVNNNPSLDIHCPNEHLTTPLLAAIDRSDPAILALVIDKLLHTCNLDACTLLVYPCARTALMHAAFTSNEPEILHVLIKRGADPNRTDVNGWNCLFYAIIGKRLRNVVLLLDNVEDLSIESRDLEGRSPLMISVYLSNTEIFDCLLSRGADVNALDNNGLSVLHIAILRRKRDCVIKLMKSGYGGSADLELLTPYSRVSTQKLVEELMSDILPISYK